MMVRSWYPGLDLQVLTGLSAGSEADVSAAWPAICHRASEICSMINPAEYTPCLDHEGVPLPVATFSELVYSRSSSDMNATPEGACQTTSTSSSSGQYANSGLNGEDSTSSGTLVSPATPGKGKQPAKQPQPSSTEGPSATPAELSTSAPVTAPHPATTTPASGNDTAA